MKKTSKIFNYRVFSIILSLFVAIFLYFNANASLIKTEGNSGSNGSPTQLYSTTLKEVPVDLTYDDSKYFVSSTTNSANVALSSYNQVHLIQEESTDLRSFSLEANLEKLGLGNFQVPITALNLPSGMNAQVVPATLNVTIENKTKKEFTVVPAVDKKLLKSGYEIDTIKLNTSTVQVTSGEETIKKIASVEAVLPTNTDLTSNFAGYVNLIAIDSQGHTVNAVINPTRVYVHVDIKSTSSSKSSSSSSSSK